MDNRKHTCGSCQYENVPDQKYPCNQCTWSMAIRQDLWTPMKKLKTYEDIYNEFCDRFPLAEVVDYRPAVEMHVPQLSERIPNAIIVWLKDGTKVIYIAESEDKE